jgi:hypothetical protein
MPPKRRRPPAANVNLTDSSDDERFARAMNRPRRQGGGGWQVATGGHAFRGDENESEGSSSSCDTPTRVAAETVQEPACSCRSCLTRYRLDHFRMRQVVPRRGQVWVEAARRYVPLQHVRYDETWCPTLCDPTSLRVVEASSVKANEFTIELAERRTRSPSPPRQRRSMLPRRWPEVLKRRGHMIHGVSGCETLRYEWADNCDPTPVEVDTYFLLSWRTSPESEPVSRC